MTKAKKVIFVTGAEHSGTSLLSMMLSVTNDALFAGEVERCRSSDEHVCLTCGSDCPIWKDFLWHRGESAHEMIAQKSGASIIIDSTKQPVSWIAEQTVLLTELEIPCALILLMRDPRAVIAESFKKEPLITIEQHTKNWYTKTGAREKLFRNVSTSHTAIRVRYEELTQKAEETVRTICESIKLPFDERMLYPGKAHQHRLVRKVGTKKRIDETLPFAKKFHKNWKDELDDETIKHIEEITGVLFPLYRWES